MVNIIEQDITRVGELPRSPGEKIAIAHGVNCQGRMGSGVAKSLFTKWYAVKGEYLRWHTLTQPPLGHVQTVHVGDGVVVFNCWTQETYGPPGTGVHADLRAIRTCLGKAAAFCIDLGIKKLYTPKIGCGLGGLQWSEVGKIYDEVQSDFPDIEIIVCVNS